MSREFVATFPHSKKISSSIFHGANPVGSALKAFNQKCKSNKPCSEVIVIEEPINGSKHAYKVERKSDPKTVMLNGSEVHFKFSAKAKAIPLDSVKKTQKKLIKKKKIYKCIQKCKKM
jgi:hypothetical protein